MPVTWIAIKQGGVCFSTMEAKLTAASVVVVQMLGVRELFGEFGVKGNEPMILYLDHQAALKQLGGDGPTAKSKHVDVRIKIVSSHAKNGLLMPTYLESCRMPADLMTKTVPAPRLEELRVLVGLNDNASETKNE